MDVLILFLVGVALKKKISPISLFPIHIEMMRNDKKIGDGTGFIFYHLVHETHFLITNYHVLTARIPTDPARLLEGYPDSPDELRWSALRKDNKEAFLGGVDLLSENGINWIEHEDRAKGVDIVALKIIFDDDTLVMSQEKLGLVDDIALEVGAELFIVGFPFGLGVGDFFPLWKKGTIASEPLIKPNGLSRFYIDATTMPGMSGSPVFAMEERRCIDLKGESAAAFHQYEAGEATALDLFDRLEVASLEKSYSKKYFRLVGIYSGRLVDGKKDPSIGIVWNYELIEQMFSNPVFAEHPFPPHKVDG